MSEEEPPIQPTRIGPAAQAEFSLSQAILAPMDAVLKAQVHAARSFVSFLLQIGYPHDDRPPEADPDRLPYHLEFDHVLPDGRRQKVNIPTLALVPVNPLGVTSADFKFAFYVRSVAKHRQLSVGAVKRTAQEKSADEVTKIRTERDWFLVDEPLSLRGTFAPSTAAPPPSTPEVAQVREQESRLEISVKVEKLPVPAALERLLTSLSQSTTTTPAGPAGTPPTTK